jgi:hypothetical protein
MNMCAEVEVQLHAFLTLALGILVSGQLYTLTTLSPRKWTLVSKVYDNLGELQNQSE